MNPRAQFCKTLLREFCTAAQAPEAARLRLRRAPGTWSDVAAQKAEMDKISQQLNLESMDGWYTVKQSQIKEHGGDGIVKRYGTLSRALESIYPEHNWQKWRFKKRALSSRFDSIALEAEVERIGKALGIKSIEGWYNVEYKQFVQLGAKALLRVYEDSPYKLLMAVYPHHEWLPWKFKVAPHGFWSDVKNQRRFMEHLLVKIKGLKLPEGFDEVYTLKRGDIREAGGRTLLTYYDHTIARLFSTIFPEHKWEEWKFYWASSLTFWRRQASVGDFSNARAVLESLSRVPEINIQSLDDWYRVGIDIMTKYKAVGMIKAYGGMYPLLKGAYPEYSWDESKFARSSKASSERHLGSLLALLFPDQNIESRARLSIRHDQQSSKKTQAMLAELDFYIPALRLGVEYQGVQHFEDVYTIGQAESQKATDTSKYLACAQYGISLVEIPYTAELTKDTLIEAIGAVRPDLADLARRNT